MNLMAIDRRQTLAGLVASGFLPSVAMASLHNPVSGFLSAFSTPDQKHGVALLGKDRLIKKTLEITQRGHGFAISEKSKKAIAFARRPGTHAHVIDLPTFTFVNTIHAREGRHFYGHGCFSLDGRWLFVSENDFDRERGVIGIYDARNEFSREAEIPSYGIGPHEVNLMPDGRTLVVANGGILTHPSAPRLNLNVDDMRPSLAFIDVKSGQLKRRIEPPARWSKLSIRHFDINSEGTIIVAMQWEGPEIEHPPLLGCVKPEALKFDFFEADADIQRRMKNYCGSVRFNVEGNQVIASSPRGNLCTVWNLEGKLLASVEVADGCGVEGFGPGFFVTGGAGDILKIEAKNLLTEPALNHGEAMWDNHLNRF